jgi:bifunctional oligoribonuclease and PAP phosphatase NrnA
VKAKIAEKLHQVQRVAIASHIRPDADSIGSGLALSLMLRQLGKDVCYCNTDPAPRPLSRLPGYGQIEYRQIHPEPFDAVVLIEGGTEERTGQKHLPDYFTINIDHHGTSTNDADLNWVVPEAAAVGELIYELGLELGIAFDRDIAFNLYAAIASDTGSFKYSNTSYRALHIAAELVRHGGFAPVDVSNLLFNSNPLEKIRMMTRVLSTLEMALDARVAMIEFHRSFLPALNLHEIETEDIISIARSINDVQVLLFFKEIEDGLYRVSIRSRDDFSAQKVAQEFNGGGHHHAAGFFYRGDLASAKRDILSVIRGQMA